MTDPVDPLILQFAANRPDEMAALLANTELQELSTMLHSLPVASAASLAARLPSWQLNGLMGTISPALLARMLRTAKTDEAVALVSHLNESRYAGILDAVPTAERRSLYELLEFPSYSVASLVTTDFIRVADNTSCKVFCEQLSASADTSPGPVLVVDQQGRYCGILSLAAAYSRRNRARAVGQIATNVEPLNGNTAASTALTARQWAKYSELPVVDSRHRILGIVNRVALERVAGDSTPLEFNFERVLSELSTAYLTLCARVLESVLGRTK